MNVEKITRIGAIRLGNDYQDIVAMDLILQYFEHPKDFEWIKVEAYDEAKFLDDVYAKLTSGKIIAHQIKYATDSSETWNWNDLLKQNEGRLSLFQKWFNSWEKISTQGEIEEISLWTNRKAEQQLKLSLGFNDIINIEKIEKDIWKEIIKQCDNEIKVKEVLKVFKFKFNAPDFESLEESTSRRLEKLGISSEGKRSLKDTIRDWTVYKEKPFPDGRIRLKDIKVAAQWYNLKLIPQNFEIPNDYILPTQEFHRNILDIINLRTDNLIVINAPPALGKSTYLSFLTKELKKYEIPVIRHHYFLSIRDKTPDRFNHRKIFESLMKEIQNNYFDVVEDDVHNPSPEFFLTWLKKCGEYFLKKDKPFVVIIDGLDHVYREQDSIVELNKLFDQLLPVEDGVIVIIGTQPIDDKYLPSKLLQLKPRDRWLDLPLLSKNAVEKWVINHSDEPSLKLDNKNEMEYRIPPIVNAFYKISKGHPLVLKLSLKELLIKHESIYEYQILNLTEHLNSRDIRDYYGKLWIAINTTSKFILILFASCPYEWSKEQVLDVLVDSLPERSSLNDAFEAIQHLLINDLVGWRLFHKSINIFIENTPEFSENKNFILQKALKWIKQGKSNYIKWAYEWRLEAEINNPNPIINGTSREWLIDAIMRQYPQEDINIILQKCGEMSLKHKNFLRFVENGLLSDYYTQATKYEKDGLKTLLLPRVFINEEDIIIKKFKNHLDDMEYEELLDYARLEKDNGNEDIIFELFEHVNDRIKYGHKEVGENPVEILTKIAALSEKVSIEGIVQYVSDNRKQNKNLRVLKYFCDECLYSKLKYRMINLFEKKSNLIQKEINILGDYLALLSIEDQTDITVIIGSNKIESSLWVVNIYLSGKLNEKINLDFPRTEVLNRPEYELYQYRKLIEEMFCEIFFVFLAKKLQDQDQENENFIKELSDYSWARQFINKLYLLSQDIFILLKDKHAFSYANVLNHFKDLKKPDFLEDKDDYEFGDCAGKALITISNELFRIFHSLNPVIKISSGEIKDVLSSEYVFLRVFLEKYLEHNRRYLDDTAFEYLIEYVIMKLNISIDIFYERAIDYALLSRIYMLHGNANKCAELVKISIENTIAYGSHKDLYFSGCLEVIENLYRAGVKEIGKWILQLIPPILSIRDYTDGDETRYIPENLADTLYILNKEIFLDYYKWLLYKEEYWYAEYVFHLYLKNVNLSNDIGKAVVKTAIDAESLELLNSKVKSGNEEAAKISGHLERLYGEFKNIDKKQETSLQQKVSNRKEDIIIKYNEFPPEKFFDFLESQKKDSYELKKPLSEWLKYWSSTPNVISAINTIESFIGNNEYEDFDLSFRMFELIKKYKGKYEAYPWLISSIINNYSWQRYFSNRDEIRNIFSIIKKDYPEKWEQFICDSMINKYSKKIDIGASFKYHHLIEFLVEMDQIELAKKIALVVINFGLELVSPLKFDKPNWILNYE